MLTPASFALSLLLTATAAGAEPQPDTWAATDAVGRTLPMNADVGAPRADRIVAVFYHTWHGSHSKTGPHDVSKILAANPNALVEPDNPAWGPEDHFHHWGEPLFGYYTSTDEWVYRRHAQMLSAAGVDAIIFDATNQFSYPDEVMALCRAFADVRAHGGDTPRIAFMTPFVASAEVVREIYDYLYAPGLYQDLWFRWEGKPLVLANPECIQEPELLDFFTYRFCQPDMFAGPTWPPNQGPERPNMWSWLEVFPQHVYRDAQGVAEMMSVGIGQNAVGDRLCAFTEPGTRGRSWHDGRLDTREGAVNLGLGFQEQWDRALKEDPEIIYVTGWNEWTAMRMSQFGASALPVMFVDQFTEEYSRDAEPMRGGHGDNYYMQLAANIRRFKGARPAQPAPHGMTIDLAEPFTQWDGAGIEYTAYAGDTQPRDHQGYGETHYVNTTGRNDITTAKVTHDEKNLYFMVQTAAPLSPSSDPNWMMLFLNVDGDPATGWHGYDYIVNRVVGDGQTGLLERHAPELPGGGSDAWMWRPAGVINFRVEESRMMLAIPRSLLIGAPSPEGRQRLLSEIPSFTIDFKWSDNFMAQPKADALAAGADPASITPDILDFYVSGDVAPTGRFNFRYEVKEAPAPDGA